MFIKRENLYGKVPSVVRETKPDIQITVQAKDSETADTIMKEFRKSVRRVRRLAGNPLAGKKIRYTVFNETILASARILPEESRNPEESHNPEKKIDELIVTLAGNIIGNLTDDKRVNHLGTVPERTRALAELITARSRMEW